MSNRPRLTDNYEQLIKDLEAKLAASQARCVQWLNVVADVIHHAKNPINPNSGVVIRDEDYLLLCKIYGDPDPGEPVLAQLKELHEKLAASERRCGEMRSLVKAQAADDGLWFQAVTCAEAYLQQELRKLHALIECPAGGGKEPA